MTWLSFFASQFIQKKGGITTLFLKNIVLEIYAAAKSRTTEVYIGLPVIVASI
jgi:hypothetical protein